MLQHHKTQFICSITHLDIGVRNTRNYKQIILTLLRLINAIECVQVLKPHFFNAYFDGLPHFKLLQLN